MNTQAKKDLKKTIQESLLDFWDKVLEPPFDRLYQKVDSLDDKVGRLDKRVSRLDKRVSRLEEDVKDIKETTVRIKDRVDDVAAEVISHERRLRKVERKVSLSI